MHQYDPMYPRLGPQFCTALNCVCKVFRQPEPGERIKRHAPNGIDWERSAVVEDIERDFSGTSMAGEHPDTEVHIEHGQPWVTCLCGASWSVVDTGRGLDYERIDEGDDSYHLQPNGRATVADPIAARELDLYIANTYELVGAPNSIGKSIDANLKRKLASGKYDPALAPKAWQYLVDEGTKRYEREFGSDSPIFNAASVPSPLPWTSKPAPPSPQVAR